MKTSAAERIKQLVDWELVLAADHVRVAFAESHDKRWKLILPLLLDDLQQLLRDAMDLLRELGEAHEHTDRSYWDLPSITPHWQNRPFRDWVILIELLRDAWLEIYSQDPSRAEAVAQAWFEIPYPVFKRLALFGASRDACVSRERWVDWLLADGGRWLWNVDVAREVFRLLSMQGGRLDGSVQKRLEEAIVIGPSPSLFQPEIEPDVWRRFEERAVWLRLAKLHQGGLVLGSVAAARFAELSIAHERWTLEPHQREEFSHWMSGTGDPDYDESREIVIAPRGRQELALWLSTLPISERTFFEDNWRDVCRTRFSRALIVLNDLALAGVWPSRRWSEALQVWSEEGAVERAWGYAAPVVQTMPDATIKELTHSLTWWMQAASKITSRHEGILLDLCQRVMALTVGVDGAVSSTYEPIERPVAAAINHPIGHTAQALVNLWLGRKPNDSARLPADIEPLFTRLCDREIQVFRHGRVLLAAHLISLFRVDREWTERRLLPLFSWRDRSEAQGVWEGFLWSPRLYQPLLTAIKPDFLESANHYVELGEHRQQFAAFLTYAALGPIDGYTADEFRSAVSELPTEGLEEAAQALSQALDGAAEQREDYWENRVKPFWTRVWPKSLELVNSRISESLARLVIAAGDKFPAAFAMMADWLRPIDHPDYVVQLLHESGACREHAIDALRLLNAVVASREWAPSDLGSCLEEIEKSAPQISSDADFRRLKEFYRRRA